MTRRLFAVLSLALALRLIAAFVCDGQTFSSDEAHWQRMAEFFWRDGVFSPEAGFFRPPLYPLAVAGVYDVLGYHPFAVRLVQALLSTATCALVFAIARAARGERAGLYAGLLAACHPLMVFFSGIFMAETLLLACVAAILWQVQCVVARPSAKRAAVLGAMLALGALCKPVVLAWLPLLLVMIWLCGPRPSIRVAAVVVALVLCVMPWTLRNIEVSGHAVPISTNLGINLLVGHEPGATGRYSDAVDYWQLMEEIAAPERDPVLRDAVVARRVLAHIADEPLRALRLAATKVILLWSPLGEGAPMLRTLVNSLTSATVLALGGLGLWHMRRDPVGWAAASLAVALMGIYALFFAHVRFRLPIDLALIAPAACWLAHYFPGKSTDERV